MPILHNNEDAAPRANISDLFIADLWFDTEQLHVRLKGGAEVVVPLWWYPRLQHALPEQRERWELCAGGRGVHWPDIDEDLDAYGFVYGLKAPGAVPPKEH